MLNLSTVSGGREWVLFWVRWVLLLLSGGLFFFVNSQFSTPVEGQTLIRAAAIAAAANAALLPFLLIRKLHPVLPLVALGGDLVMAGVFTIAAASQAWTLTGILLLLLIGSLVRFSFPYSVVSSVGILIVAVATIASMRFDLAQIGVTLPLGIGVAGAVAVVAVAYGLERLVGAQRIELEATHESRSLVTQQMRDRMRGIYDLSFTMGSTLKYEKILDAALEAGRLGMRLPDGLGTTLISAVLLFHADDNALHVVSSRRLTRADASRVIPGRSGIIGEALKEAVPVFGTDAKKDPELQYFAALQYCRSILCIPLRAGYDNFGVLLYASEKPRAFSEEQSELLTAIGIQATIALQNAVLYESLMREKERIVEVQEDARKKLARDLHDGPTQSVAAIAMRINAIARMVERAPSQAVEELRKVEDLARKTTKEIRHMLFTLRPLVLETQGLAAAVQQLAQKTEETHDLPVAVRVAADVEKALDYNQQGVLFYIIEEAVNNARKHARASLVSVLVRLQNDVVVAQISDNGRGFNLNEVEHDYEKRGSLGMTNMRERAELLDGTLSIDSVEGRGTVVTVIVPLQAPAGIISDSPLSQRPVTKLALAATSRLAVAQDMGSLA
jgi:signal transduction histidine kinase